MKAPGMGMFTNEGHSTDQIIKYVLQDRDPFSTPRYAVEEVFHSKNATKVDNRYEFSFPQSWYNGNLNNKSIGLRKIQVIRRPIVLDCALGYTGTRKLENEPEKDVNAYQPIKLIVPGEWSIERILNELQYLINNKIATIFGTINLTYYDQTVHCEFNAISGATCTKMFFRKYPTQSETGWVNFCKTLFGREYRDQDINFIADPANPTKHYTYDHDLAVWDRHNIFFHASFANNSTNNYLSINDEFFYKPSKIYEYNFNPINFQIWTTLDGLTPIYVEGLEFLIELCLMHNDRRVTV